MHNQQSSLCRFIVINSDGNVLPPNCATVWLFAHFCALFFSELFSCNYDTQFTIRCAITDVSVVCLFMHAFRTWYRRAVHIHARVWLLSVESSIRHYHHWRSILARLVHHPCYLRLVPFHVGVWSPLIELSTLDTIICKILLRISRAVIIIFALLPPLYMIFWRDGNLA